MESDNMSDGINFSSLGDLINSGNVDVGTLATAIEKYGVQGYDRHNRFKTFKFDEPAEIAPALDALAEQATWERNVNFLPPNQHPSEMAPADWNGSDHPLFRYGWAESSLPDLAALLADQPPAPKQVKRPVKNENADLVVIGAMLAFIRGDFSEHPHPEYETEGQLAALLSVKLRGIPGGSESSLQKKWAFAKRRLAEA
jgi:hypothetical protein